jgi:hypothetical protein
VHGGHRGRATGRWSSLFLMSRFTEIRIRLLAAIAIGLATALVVHAFTRDPVTGKSSVWRYGSSSAESDPLVSAAVDDAESGEGAGLARPTPPEVRSGGLLIDGGDYTGPVDTPAPRPTSTSIPTAARDDDNDDRDDVSASDRNGMSVSVPTVATPTLSPEEEMLGGVRSPRGSGILSATPVASESGLPWVTGQPRGYAMLYALQPEARAVVEANVATLLASHVQQPYIAVLIDGTFGKDFGYLRELIRRLNEDGRDLHLGLYLANGPAQRRYKKPPYEAPFVRTPPEDFRREIRRSNSDAQVEYLKIIADARMLFEYNLRTNPDAKNYAVVMLEDNLERDSFRAMSQLAKDQLEAVAGIVRNPCPDCYDGNDNESLGYPLEDHSVARFESLRAGDGFTLDGEGFFYPTEIVKSGGKAITPEQLISLIKGGYQNELSYFGLWRKEWQGVEDGGVLKEPKNRLYVASMASEMEFEIQALRAGLPLLNSDEDGTNEEEAVSLFSDMGNE